MKKQVLILLAIAAVALSATTAYYWTYSWGAKADNQVVSFGDISLAVDSGYFTAKTTITSSTQTVTKADANTYLNINTSLPSYVAKASNQLVNKEDLVKAFDHSAVIYYESESGHIPTGYTSAANACANYLTNLSTTVYYNGTLGNGTLLYNFSGGYFYSNGTTGYFYISGYTMTSSAASPSQFTVANYASCSSPPTYDYYLANQYDCATCSTTPSATNVPVALPTGTTPNYSNYYFAGVDIYHSYKLTSTSTTAVSAILFTTSYSTCAAACAAAAGITP